MLSALARTAIRVAATLAGVLTVLFVLIRAIPGDPAQTLLGTDATAADLARLRHDLGLDRSVLVQYAVFLGDAVTGRWGVSLATRAPVLDRVVEVLPGTVELCLAAVVIIVAVSLPAGIAAAIRRGRALDHGIGIGVVVLMSMPQFWLGLLLLLVGAYWLGWFPIFGNGEADAPLDRLWHLALPAATLAAGFLGITTRLTRASMIEALGRDYIRTARAKGVREGAVVLRHALRNALLSVLTVIGLIVGQLLGGAVIVEVVFARDGMGTLIWDAILQRDYPQVQATVAVFATLFVLTTVLTDALYAVLDPRIRLR